MQSSTVLIGNGDVLSMQQAHQYHREYGVDGIMIARGVFQNLSVFNCDQPDLFTNLSVLQKIDLLKQHMLAYQNVWGMGKRYGVLKKFFKIYIQHFPAASELRGSLTETDSYQEAFDILDRYQAEYIQRHT